MPVSRTVSTAVREFCKAGSPATGWPGSGWLTGSSADWPAGAAGQAGLEDLQVAQDTGERRPQLVRDRRQEIGLGFVDSPQLSHQPGLGLIQPGVMECAADVSGYQFHRVHLGGQPRLLVTPLYGDESQHGFANPERDERVGGER